MASVKLCNIHTKKLNRSGVCPVCFKEEKEAQMDPDVLEAKKKKKILDAVRQEEDMYFAELEQDEEFKKKRADYMVEKKRKLKLGEFSTVPPTKTTKTDPINTTTPTFGQAPPHQPPAPIPPATNLDEENEVSLNKPQKSPPQNAKLFTPAPVPSPASQQPTFGQYSDQLLPPAQTVSSPIRSAYSSDLMNRMEPEFAAREEERRMLQEQLENQAIALEANQREMASQRKVLSELTEMMAQLVETKKQKKLEDTKRTQPAREARAQNRQLEKEMGGLDLDARNKFATAAEKRLGGPKPAVDNAMVFGSAPMADLPPVEESQTETVVTQPDDDFDMLDVEGLVDEYSL